MLKQFKKHIDNKLPFLKEGKLLIAISGGLDSVVLTHLCHELKLNVTLAHCNFNLRNDESNADEQFVVDVADKLALEVFVQNFDTEVYAKTYKLSIQMAARKLRYDWFNELAEQLQFDYILTAHHADDNLETFLINLSRGTGLDGLTGIPEQNDKILRPLLSFSRKELEDYAKEHQIKWREDTSNASDKYLRNALRHHVIPKLKELNPQLLKNFKKTTSHLKDSQAIVSDKMYEVEKGLVSKKENGEIHFDIKKLKALPNPKAYYLFQLLKNYGFSEWNDIEDLLDAQSGKQILSSTYRLVKNRNELILREIVSYFKKIIIIEKIEKAVKTPNGNILFFDEADALFGKRTNVSGTHDKFSNTIVVDKDLLKFPLSLRGWEDGDYFYPFGMKGKKKLSKFFKDEKLSLLEKEKIQLLCSGEDIIWVVGKRFDDRFKVTDKTKHILKITFE